MASTGKAALEPLDGGEGLRILYQGSSADIGAEGRTALAALAEDVSGGEGRIQLKAYGGAEGDSSSAARRLSLNRALGVRSYLIEKGVRGTRIDVRALGFARDGGPNDRVDVLVLGR